MIAYKAFNPGLTCRGYQFQMGRNVTDEANCAKNGFHSAENPMDCLTYYRDVNNSEFYLVDVGGDLNEDGTDTKIASTELQIIKKLSPEDLFLHGLAFMVDHPFRDSSPQVQKDSATASDGYAVVRGENPQACGKIGDILAFAQQKAGSKEIIKISLTKIDGIEMLPNVWYDIDFVECEEQ